MIWEASSYKRGHGPARGIAPLRAGLVLRDGRFLGCGRCRSCICGLPIDEFRPDNELERPFRINRFEIDVEEVLVGSLGKPSIVLRATEIFLSALHDTARTQPGEISVLFLENIGVEFLPLGYDSEDN